MPGKWVCHISGQGQKWRVRESPYNKEVHEDWLVDSAATLRDPMQSRTERYHWLPKSEYKECEGPEEWEDVTWQYETNGRVIGPPGHQSFQVIKTSDRIRKVIVNAGLEAEGWAFIIERRKA
jgi:hypothetical protein